MVKACKGYLTDDGLTRLWDQPRPELLTKIQHCIDLYNCYQNAFQRTKQRIEDIPGEKPFEFSEMYIFGKFDAFCKRLTKASFIYWITQIIKKHFFSVSKPYSE